MGRQPVRLATSLACLYVAMPASVASECGAAAGCAACTQLGCVWTNGFCAVECSGAECATAKSQCCGADPTRSKVESWLCADGCNHCTCGADRVVAAGCPGMETNLGVASGGEDGVEAALVHLALLPVIGCFICALAICYLMMCYKRVGKEPKAKSLADEEADQLAAGD